MAYVFPSILGIYSVIFVIVYAVNEDIARTLVFSGFAIGWFFVRGEISKR